eukprot:5154848-Pleurochrysis_carterae.AAC.1
MMLERWDARALGCCRLHTRVGERFPHHLLMAQPPFQAWLKRTRGRVQLVLSFKLLVLTDTGVLATPPNCVYDQGSLERSKALG